VPESLSVATRRTLDTRQDCRALPGAAVGVAFDEQAALTPLYPEKLTFESAPAGESLALDRRAMLTSSYLQLLPEKRGREPLPRGHREAASHEDVAIARALRPHCPPHASLLEHERVRASAVAPARARRPSSSHSHRPPNLHDESESPSLQLVSWLLNFLRSELFPASWIEMRQ